MDKDGYIHQTIHIADIKIYVPETGVNNVHDCV